MPRTPLTPASTLQDWARFTPLPAGGVTLMDAHFTQHRFDPHAHDTWSIGVTHSGLQRFGCRGKSHTSSAGGLLLFNPDEPHDGERGSDAGFGYSILYVDESWVRQWMQHGEPRAQRPQFDAACVHDAATARHVLRAVNALRGRQETLMAETALHAAFALALGQYGASRLADGTPRNAAPMRLQRVRDYLEAHATEDVQVADLAQQAGLSRAHLTRAFAATFGQPPHAYLNTVRLRTARQALLRGATLADAAATGGFADQSHFTRRFKGAVGVTPGAWLAQLRR
jgi:AraC-like DNA-binding protein